MFASTVHRTGLCLVGLLIVGTFGCFEDPVEEIIVIGPTEQGSIELSVQTILRMPENASNASRQAIEARLRSAEEELLGGLDAWTRRFERVLSARETMSWIKSEGRLERLERTALVTDPDELGNFFADTGISVAYAPSVGQTSDGSLAFFAGAATRASRKQTEEVEQALELWGSSVTDYLGVLRELFVYLETKPRRAGSVYGYLLSERLSESDLERVKPLETGAEQAAVDALEEAMLAVADVLTPKAGAAFSLDELSRLAYDPFPATVIVALPTPPSEVVGFEETGTANQYRLVSTSLIQSLEQLSSEWMSIDPLSLWLEGEMSPTAPELDLATLVETPRSIDAPANREGVLDALRRELRPRTEYRLVW